MTDAQRMALAVRRGRVMAGPLERQRCSRHVKRWETYRWTWPVGETPESGETEIVRSCGTCHEEYADE